jgi:hypothetical protein
MQDWKRSPIAGKVYTVEDLIHLPEAGAVDPDKAREVSHRLPVRFWMETPALIALLEDGIKVIQANQRVAAPEDARQAEVLIAQRQLWIRHLKATDDEMRFIGIFPASVAGEEYDSVWSGEMVSL